MNNIKVIVFNSGALVVSIADVKELMQYTVLGLSLILSIIQLFKQKK